MHILNYVLFICAFLAGHLFGVGYVPNKLFVSIYYESRCPDTRAFVLRQLQPAMKVLSNRIMLRLVPFGKAKSLGQGYGGFACQHGPSECLGNMIQSCTLDMMLSRGRTDAQMVDYVACEMATYASTNGDLTCVQKANISPDMMNHCITSGKGTELQLEAEFLTRLIHPKFIPTITIDGMFDQQIQDHSLIDLVGALCSILKETKECARHYNNIALKYVLL